MSAVHGPTSPEQIPGFTQQQLRDRYLVEDLFVPGSVRTVVTHYDRVVAVGAVPTDVPLALEAVPEIRSEQFLDHREIGIDNIGAAGAVHADARRNARLIEVTPDHALRVRRSEAGGDLSALGIHAHSEQTIRPRCRSAGRCVGRCRRSLSHRWRNHCRR